MTKEEQAIKRIKMMRRKYRYELEPWMPAFLKSVREFRKERGFLSQKQIQAVDNIWTWVRKKIEFDNAYTGWMDGEFYK